MFITEINSESPLSMLYCNPQQQGWDSFELSLRSAWFLVDYSHFVNEKIGPASVLRTTSFINFSDVEEFLTEISIQKDMKLRFLYIIFPLRKNNDSTWKLKVIRRIWTSHKRIGLRTLYLFETSEGDKFLESGFAENQDFTSFTTLAHEFST